MLGLFILVSYYLFITLLAFPFAFTLVQMKDRNEKEIREY